jgi:sulfite dehydrogenase (quinone) subunit SoeC
LINDGGGRRAAAQNHENTMQKGRDMFVRPSPLGGEEFGCGFRLQTTWSWSMATAFFFGEIGAGLFFVSLVFGFRTGLVVGLLLTAVGKTAGHLVHLGQPTRAWRAIFRLNSSWISRGLLAIVVFTACGTLHILDVAGLTFGLLPHALSPVVTVLAGTAAVVVMVYQGFAMSHSTAIALWSTGLMPIISFTYALLSGICLMRVLAYDFELRNAAALDLVRTGLVLYGLMALIGLLHSAKYNSPGGRLSAVLLSKAGFAKWFILLVMVVGLIVPGLLAMFAPRNLPLELVVAAAVLAGYYSFRVLLLKAAVYEPIQSFLPETRLQRASFFGGKT